MSKLVWDKAGEHFYETGVSKGVLYTASISDTSGSGYTYSKGVAWNGLTSVSESPDGAEPNAIYADNIKYLNLLSVEEFKATIEAYTYPEEFAACNGEAELVANSGVYLGQQDRIPFALCYQTKVGNDLDPNKGYKIHIIYGALAQPTEKSYETVNDSPDAITMSWEISTTPVEVAGFKPTAYLVIDSTKCDATKLINIENKLYGSSDTEPILLLPDEIVAILNA